MNLSYINHSYLGWSIHEHINAHVKFQENSSKLMMSIVTIIDIICPTLNMSKHNTVAMHKK